MTKDAIIDWFSKKTEITKQEISSKTAKNYFDEGWLDSLTFLELIVYMEKTFSIKFSAEEFQNPEFATIDGLVQIIESKI